MLKTVAIISLNFRAAHISHLIASYNQMLDLGFQPILIVNEKFIPFLPEGIKYKTKILEVEKIDLAIFWFPAIGNIKAMINLKYHHHAKILYVYHEPFDKFSSYLKAGNSKWWTIKYFLKYLVGLSFLKLADCIILPSEKALNLYKSGIAKKFNRKYHYLPLLYMDERLVSNSTKRKYFSYIGSLNFDHAFPEYVDLIYYIFKNNPSLNLLFLIATWADMQGDNRLEEMKAAGVLKVVSGKPMPNEEINEYYASSYLVWNAYNRSTQSGVLAKSFMFGTPGLIMKSNLSEFVQDGREVIAIDSNSNYSEMINALKTVLDNFDSFSRNARECFEQNYLYSIHNENMKNIISSL